MNQTRGALPERISFPEEEENILKLWDEWNAFFKSMELSKDRPPFTFYDGPPFATGLPHYGHLLAGTIKDIVTRFAHQSGYYVERRFGWDCHGLPVEYEINKSLNVKGKEDVEKMGIAKYNDACRGIVQRYSKEWEKTVKRIGRWIDTENDYKTMEPWYMESVWNVFKTIFEKDLVYRGYKILPYSTACNTPLSNFEANMDYRDVPDPSVVVNFPLLDEPEVSLLAWTTTPWTLPSNLALCVNPAFEYWKITDLATGKLYVICNTRLVQLYPKMEKKGYKPGNDYEVLEKWTGKDLVGRKYKPLFDCYKDWPNAFQVLEDSYVTSENGTGIVHQAPAFGEDDYRVCGRYDIIQKSQDIPCPIDDNGRFTDLVDLVKGLHVKEADDIICKELKANGRLVSKNTFVHSYPFCYRSGTPLIYRAVPSWFVNVEKIKDNLVKNNEKTYWVPAFVKEKRFHNWLVDARDWTISRNRFWGTPLPLWVSNDFEEVVCIGSIEELRELSGEKVEDLHREHIDHITIPSKQGKGTLKRVEEVFDCWFESGSMPYAQQHYPFENQEKFLNGFPADFIAEGLDQTRGWFYTLMVISTAMFNKPAFKNLIVNGLVLAEDGRKMSKSLKNYPDPNLVLSKYGADALRLYLINSPVVRAEPLKFQEAGVLGVVREIFLPWFNAMRFFGQNATRLEENTGKEFVPDFNMANKSSNVMDSWILAALHSLIKYVQQEMKAYRLYTVVPRLIEFIKQLTNWYVRLNRKRLKGSEGDSETFVALSTLYEVLYQLAKIMAPFTPFYAEYMYQFLKQYYPNVNTSKEDADGNSKSIHFLMLPSYNADQINEVAEKQMQNLQSVIETGRIVRERRAISLKNPVKEVIVVCPDEQDLLGIEALKSYIDDELNVRNVIFTSKEREWCTLMAEANNKALGKRFGKAFGAVKKEIMKLSHDQVSNIISENKFTLSTGETLTMDDLVIKREFKGDKKNYEADVSSDGKIMVVIDCREDEALKMQGYAREFINRVQKLRKKAGLVVQDKIHIFFDEAKDGIITNSIHQFTSMIETTLGSVPAPAKQFKSSTAVTIASESCEFAGSKVDIFVCMPMIYFADDSVLKKCLPKSSSVLVADVKTYVATMDYKVVSGSSELKLTLDECSFVLKHKQHYYSSVVEKVSVEKISQCDWML